MTRSALQHPTIDPTPIFEHFRGNHASELLTAAVCHFDVFPHLANQPATFDQLRSRLELAERPANVLVTALRAMGLLESQNGRLTLSDSAREHLVPGGDFDCGDYIGLAADHPGVLRMVQLLRTNRPLSPGDGGGTAFIYRDGMRSAMEAEASARHFTLALAGRAKNVAPALAEAVPLGEERRLLDIGAGTGIYSYALLQKNPHLRAVLFDRPEVLKVAETLAIQYDVQDRVEFQPGDMFTDALPSGADAILLSNVLHDWDVPECNVLLARCADALSPGKRLLIHDVFLNDELDGPLPIALYSASLFSFTEGRAYSAAEYRSWFESVGLRPGDVVPTRVHCGVLSGWKP